MSKNEIRNLKIIQQVEQIQVRPVKQKKIKKDKLPRTKRVKVVEDRKKPTKIDLLMQQNLNAISKKSRKRLTKVEAQGPYLLKDLENQRNFQGCNVEVINDRIFNLQQKAIKIELKINRLLLKKEEVKIPDFKVCVPESMTQSISEEIISLKSVSPNQGLLSQKLDKSVIDKEKPLVKKKIKRIPEVPYASDGQPKVGCLVLELPPKFLSCAEYVSDVIINRFSTWENIRFRDLFEWVNFRALRRKAIEKEKTVSKSMGLYSWLGDYSDPLIRRKKEKRIRLSMRLIPKPLVHFALRNKRIMPKFYEFIRQHKFPWTWFELKPFKYDTLPLTSISPTYTDEGVGKLHKKPQLPIYWEKIREKARYFVSSLHREFLENFGEYDLLHYGKGCWEIVKQLRERYFGNHLTPSELSLKVNKEIEPELNFMMRLLNEQPFLVFPLGASPAMYSILPELDGITSELIKHKISPDRVKRISHKDVYIRSPKGIPLNVLSNTEHSLTFSSADCENVEQREFTRLRKFRDFEVEEYSKSFYSKFSQSMLLNCSRLKGVETVKNFKRKMPFWTFLNELFLLDNDGLNPEGYLPYFERQVLREDYKKGTFTHSLMYWDREAKKVKHLNSSIRYRESKNALALKLSLLELKL